MRKFSSCGPIDRDLHYYVAREALINQAVDQLVGEDPAKGGHYITVWGPRQTGKTWVMIEAYQRLLKPPYAGQFDVLWMPLEHLKMQTYPDKVVAVIAREIIKRLQLQNISVQVADDLYQLFERGVLSKPLILILDEFDALDREAITAIVSVFRNIYIRRRAQTAVASAERDYLLHGVALIGVRAVLGVENASGSPLQRAAQYAHPQFDRR